jgi:hypothetical protein
MGERNHPVRAEPFDPAQDRPVEALPRTTHLPGRPSTTTRKASAGLEPQIRSILAQLDTRVQARAPLVQAYTRELVKELKAAWLRVSWVGDPGKGQMNREKIVSKVEMTPKGVIVTRTTTDAKVVATRQGHSGEVTELVQDGMAAMRRRHDEAALR